jgi:hypothetical protein
MSEDIVTLIIRFYAEQRGGEIANRNHTAEFMSLLRRLHHQVFPGYRLDEAQLLAQAQAQLRGNSRAVQGYHAIILKFAPLAANARPLFIHLGGMSKWGPHGLFAEDRVINEQIQSALGYGERKGLGY